MNTPNKMTREYRIDAGNSATGPVGLVAYIMAESPEKAIEIAIERWDQEGYRIEDDPDDQLLIYVNPQALTLADVWDVETDKCCAPKAEQAPAPFNYHAPWTRRGLDIMGQRSEAGLPRHIARASDEVIGDLIAAAPVMRTALEFARRTLVALGDERGAQALETIAAIDTALAAARKGGGS